jgi:hypothetical protein
MTAEAVGGELERVGVVFVVGLVGGERGRKVLVLALLVVVVVVGMEEEAIVVVGVDSGMFWFGFGSVVDGCV